MERNINLVAQNYIIYIKSCSDYCYIYLLLHKYNRKYCKLSYIIVLCLLEERSWAGRGRVRFQQHGVRAIEPWRAASLLACPRSVRGPARAATVGRRSAQHPDKQTLCQQRLNQQPSTKPATQIVTSCTIYMSLISFYRNRAA